MSFAAPEKPAWEQPEPPRGGSAWMWILLGCGGLMLVTVVLCAGGLFFGFRWGMQQVNKMTEEFVAQGYEKQMGQMIQVSQSPATKTVYVCQMLTITEDVDVDIAAVSQMVEVKADIHGDLDFIGQVLKVHPGCVIDGDLRVKNGQAIEISGEVKGKISGNWMVLNYRGKQYGPGNTPTKDEGDSKLEPAIPVPLEAPVPPLPPAAPTPPAAPVPPTPPAAPVP
jgi:hypothetical protein